MPRLPERYEVSEGSGQISGGLLGPRMWYLDPVKPRSGRLLRCGPAGYPKGLELLFHAGYVRIDPLAPLELVGLPLCLTPSCVYPRGGGVG